VCGICGFVGSPRHLDREAMLQSIRHRGPDDEGSIESECPTGVAWLGNRRLSILDLSSAGHQPMVSDDGRLSLVFNGEMYNFAEVRRELKTRGIWLRSDGDTEVVLRAWELWGVDCLARFHGMFAFAIWDATDHSLTLVRDRIGEKPLYYSLQKDRILFASELRCLLESGGVPRQLDSDGLDSFLAFESAIDPLTIIKGVRSLEAGCYAVYRSGHLKIRRYWSLASIPEHGGQIHPAEAARSVGEALRQSLSRVMRSDVPVGVLLSGGIDSTANVALLTEAGHDDLNTFSVVFEGASEALSEDRWSSLVAERFSTNHHRVTVSDEEAQGWVGDAVTRMDSPSVDGVNTFIVSRAISQAGIKVAISGQGADELFLGYPTRRSFRLLAAASGVVSPGLFAPVLRRMDRHESLQNSRSQKVVELLGRSGSPYIAAYAAQHSIFSQSGLSRLRGESRSSPTRFLRDQGGTSPLNRLSRLELAYYLKNTLLRDGDQMSMAVSLELRAPFLDHGVVESVVGMPARVKVRRGRQKPLLVDAVGARLPREIVQRPKRGFALPYQRWLRDVIEISDPLSVDMGIERLAIKQVKEAFFAGAPWPRFWALQVLAAWVDRHRVAAP
jgi:asparagine synthase (glutamine-hydrolysing)